MIKALLLEDNPGWREIITEILTISHIEVEAHNDPTCFLKKTDKCPVDDACVDFILTDNQMPHMTGLDFLEKLEQMECKIPASHKAIISGNFSFECQQRIEKLGIQSFDKPCSISKIHSWLEEIDVLP